jgi:hypothetical protein
MSFAVTLSVSYVFFQLLLLWCSDMGSSHTYTISFACHANLVFCRSCTSGIESLLLSTTRCYELKSGTSTTLITRKPEIITPKLVIYKPNACTQHDLSNYKMPTSIPNLLTPPSLKQAINPLAEAEPPRESHDFLHELRSCWDTVGACSALRELYCSRSFVASG